MLFRSFHVKGMIQVFIYCFIVGLEATSTVTDSGYTRVTNLRLVCLNESLQTTSLMKCARECLTKRATCNSFTYNSTTDLCELGSCVTTNNYTQDDSIRVYTSVPRCQDITGFNLWTNGSINSCVWYSNVTQTYTNASRDCQAKGASLYTVKHIEKLNILSYQNDQYWIGLEYFVSERVYRWADDGSIFPKTSYWSEIFGQYEPNNPGLENCIHYYQLGVKKLNDRACSTLFKYACEMLCFRP